MKPKHDPKSLDFGQKDLFESRLEDLINLEKPLCILARKLNWKAFDVKFGELFSPKKGRPAIPTRLMVGLSYLKHTLNLSDEILVRSFDENPYWQYFCGFTHFVHRPPCDFSSLSRWRKRVGEAGFEFMLQQILSVAYQENHLDPEDFDDVTVDTTVQEKNIMFPTDTRLLNRARACLVREAKKSGAGLRQTYEKEAKDCLLRHHRYSHAKQFKLAKKPLKRLRTILGRLIRDI